MKKNADRFVHAVFCDDIRREVGDKMSLMGCYQGELFVPFLPIALAKLCIFVTISTPVKRPLKALTIRVDQGETPLATIEVVNEDLIRTVPPSGEDVTRILANAGVVLSPFAITTPGEIRVVVITEDGELIGPRLRIKAMPEPGPANLAPVEEAKPATAPRKAPEKQTAPRRAPSKRIEK